MLLNHTARFPTPTNTCSRRLGCFQGHGCVPLDELFLTAPTGGRPGDTTSLALRKVAMPFFVTPGALPFFVIPGALLFFMILATFRNLF